MDDLALPLLLLALSAAIGYWTIRLAVTHALRDHARHPPRATEPRATPAAQAGAWADADQREQEEREQRKAERVARRT